MALLEIKDLHAKVAKGDREILKGVNLTINQGEVHAIMGKNGSGKSTLCQVLAGRETYEVTEGSVTYDGKDLLDLIIRVNEFQNGFCSLHDKRSVLFAEFLLLQRDDKTNLRF